MTVEPEGDLKRDDYFMQIFVFREPAENDTLLFMFFSFFPAPTSKWPDCLHWFLYVRSQFKKTLIFYLHFLFLEPTENDTHI